MGFYKYGQYVNINGTGTVRATSIDIRRRRNEPLVWSVSFDPDPSREFLPAIHASLKPDIFSAPQVINKTCSIKFQVGGDSKTFSSLVMMGYERATEENAYKTIFSGIDFSRLLLLENQSMDSWVSTASHVYTKKEIIEDVLDEDLIPNRILNFKDEKVLQVNFQGQVPIDLVNDLLYIPDAPLGDWFFNGKTFNVQPIKKGKAVDWSYLHGTGIHSCSYKESPSPICNEVIVCRTASMPAVEEFEASGESACGLQTVSLSSPKYMPQLRISEIMWGIIEKINWIDKNGKLDSEGGYNGLATGCQFIFRQDLVPNAPPNITSLARYKIEISGILASMHGLVNVFDDAFSVTVEDTPSQNKYGKIPAPQPLDNALIPDEEHARLFGERYLDEQKRLLESVVLVPTACGNPWIDPGDVVKITERGTGLETRFYVEEVHHVGTPEGLTTDLTCSHYEEA